MGLNYNVWLPHLKFTLQTMAITYPKHPNDVSIKKYYDFIQNLPIFIPMEPIGNHFLELLDKYPVTPYLDSKDHLIRWVHFIHNIINKSLGKPTITLEEALEKYYYHYKPQEEQKKSALLFIKKYVYAFIIMFLIILLIILYQY